VHALHRSAPELVVTQYGAVPPQQLPPLPPHSGLPSAQTHALASQTPPFAAHSRLQSGPVHAVTAA
jgi:hypothetical protein